MWISSPSHGTNDLSVARTVGECKSGESRGGPKEIDQLLRLAGLRQVTTANRALLATVRAASDRVRAVGRQLRIGVFDANDLTRREQKAGLDPDPFWGSHHPDLAARESELTKRAKRDRELERAFWLLKSEIWFVDPVLGMKRLLTLISTVSKRWVEGLQSEEREVLVWILTDAVVAFSVMTVTVAADAMLLSPDRFRQQTTERLSEGIASYAQLERLSKVVDKYVLSILEEEGVSKAKRVAAMGALSPTPPAYTEPLLEVLERLADRPRASRSVVQALDLVLADVMRRGRVPPSDFLRVQIDDVSSTLALSQVVVRFLAGQAGLPEEFLRAITTRLHGAESVDEAAVGPVEPIRANDQTLPLGLVAPTEQEVAKSRPKRKPR